MDELEEPHLLNKNLADKAIAASKANPDVDPKAFAKTLNPPGMLRSSLASGMLATQGRIEEALNGPKYRSFYNNIVNPKGDDVTMDSWMARAMSGDANATDKKVLKAMIGGGTLSKPDQARHSYGADIVREIAKESGFAYPNQAQAVIWSQVKRE